MLRYHNLKILHSFIVVCICLKNVRLRTYFEEINNSVCYMQMAQVEEDLTGNMSGIGDEEGNTVLENHHFSIWFVLGYYVLAVKSNGGMSLMEMLSPACYTWMAFIVFHLLYGVSYGYFNE